MDFADWMKSAQLTEASINNYVGAIKGRLTNWAQDHAITSKSITAISDLNEFATVAEKLRQTDEYKKWNVTGHGMYSAALNNYQKYLNALSAMSDGMVSEFGPYQEEVDQIQFEAGDAFDPNGQDDARDRVLREVVRRRGQKKFRQSLIVAYEGRCAITGCSVLPLLEAAHVTPYMEPETNAVTNGLLLRTDIHTLWDLGLIAVDPKTQKVWVSEVVDDPALAGSPLRQPVNASQNPSAAALEHQWKVTKAIGNNS